MLTRKQTKILRFVYRHPGCLYYSLVSRFGSGLIEGLITGGYMCCVPDAPVDKDGFQTGRRPDGSVVFLHSPGIIAAEQTIWLTPEYAVRNILIPLTIGVLSALITGLISG